MGDLFSRELIEAVTPPALFPILAPHASYCERRGAPADAESLATADAASRLGRLFNDHDAERPRELMDALVQIADLATEQGHERIMGVMQERGGERALSTMARRSPAELALHAYLYDRATFDVARARKRSDVTARFVEYLAPPLSRMMTGHSEAATKAQILGRLSAFYRGWGRTGYADVDVSETPSAVRFILLHGRTPQSVSIINEREERVPMQQVAAKQDMVVFDKASRRLSISVQWDAEESFLRGLFGEIFFGNEWHFRDDRIYTGAPLLERGREALSVDGVHGLASVELVRVFLRNAYGERAQATTRDPWLGLQRLVASRVIEDPFVEALDLRVRFAFGRGGARRVSLRMPNQIELDRRYGEPIIRELLWRRGFVIGGDDHWRLIDAA